MLSHGFPDIAQLSLIVRQTPRSAADALVGLFGLDGVEFIGYRRVQGDPRRPGGLPHNSGPILTLGKTVGRL
jgi:hypothetical protein